MPLKPLHILFAISCLGSCGTSPEIASLPQPEPTPQMLYERSCLLLEKGDPCESMRLLRLSAEQGHSAAQYTLGGALQYSESSMHRAESLVWYQRAAANGNTDAISYQRRKGTGQIPTLPFRYKVPE